MAAEVSAAPAFENRYGFLDRLLHRFAFRFPGALTRIAEMEEGRFKQELQAFTPGPPVLITGLPRSGTTILLELLAGLAPFAAHTYRDLPFLLCPMTWHGMQKGRKQDEARERAHGDGILIHQDSPEAFEEMVWMRFFREAYRGPCIKPWERCGKPEFVRFYRGHRHRIVALRRRQDGARSRYVAKNNLLIARLGCLGEAVPDATVLLPFRDPLQHAASLLKQHRRFSAMHAEDPFSRRYMAGIGHFDFGANLRPVDFGGWWSARPRQPEDAFTLAFWLEYWVAAYRHILELPDREGAPPIHPIPFESLTPDADLSALATALGLEDPTPLQERAAILGAPGAKAVDTAGVPEDLLATARGVRAALMQRALPLAPERPRGGGVGEG